jgi:Mg2+ and Co2+ transporter CorA
MRTKKGGDFSRILRNMTSQMPRMSIFPRMSIRSRRSRRVMPSSIISESTSNTAKSIEQLKKTIKSIEENIVAKNDEYKIVMEEAKTALRSGNKIQAKKRLRIARMYENQVNSLEIKKSNLKASLDTLVSLTSTAEAVQELKSRVASTPRKGGKIMRKSKRRIIRIRKTRRHKI